ncbi:MAG: hypothetical protein ABR936_14345 [Bacteroidota bacterium]|jgi:hypothetical protein
MKTTLRLILLVAVIVLSMTALIAQTKDVVYLKNGSVIKGSILEMIPDKSIKIQTADGNIFVYNMSEVEKISKEAAVPAPSNESKPVMERSNEGQRSYEGQSSSEGSGAKFSIYGGMALPLGVFAKKLDEDENAGGAKLGWSAGMQFVTGGTIGWIIDGNYSQNKLDYPMSFTTAPGKYEWVGWSSILALTGIKIGTDNSSGANFFIAPLVGALFGKSPEIKFTPTGSSTSYTVQPSASATAFAYGAAVQVIFGGHVTLGAKYVASKPKFKYSTPALYAGGPSEDHEFDQNISLLLVSLGVAF